MDVGKGDRRSVVCSILDLVLKKFYFLASAVGLNKHRSSTSKLMGLIVVAKDLLVSISIDICAVVTDLLAFFICLWKVWSTWRLKRETSIQSNNDLVTMLFKQGEFQSHP